MRTSGSGAFVAALALTLVLAAAFGRVLFDLEPLWLGVFVVVAGAVGAAWGLSVLARRWLAPDRDVLERNVHSLEETNRELVEARAEVVRAARLASVGTLAAGVAHEVGNPLGAIMGYVDVARGRAARGEAEPEILDSIREEAERIDRIVKSLLGYARPREEHVGPEEPGAVVTRVRELLEQQGKLADVDAHWEVAPDTPEVVMNAHRFEQVLVNLVLNALDAMEGGEGPVLRVRAYGAAGEVGELPSRREGDPPGVNYMHRRRVSRDEGGRGVDPVFLAERVAVVEVQDSGPGIAEEHLEQIFDPFFTTKELGKGTGLGLSICARLVEGMGGRIEAGNVPEGGARFMIRLPAAHSARSDPRPEVT
ncbi:MAG: ATP-binding protein [Gemmatimonadota bacterium]|nr:ATP-binding protein [Gemmatimonadota bacterium]